MKVLKYSLLQGYGDDETPILLATSMVWSEGNEEIVKMEAYEGEYTIEETDDPETTPTPTLETRVEALEVDAADTKEALEMILAGVTE